MNKTTIVGMVLACAISLSPSPQATATLVAWGENDEGQCNVPAEAQSGVRDISAGGRMTMALKDGKVLAWGENWEGQCNVPAEAQSGVTAIDAGGFFAMALKDGRVLAWGSNYDGESTVPVDAQSGVTAIAAGGYHSVALRDGKVLAWGWNGQGQCSVPIEAQSGVTAIAAGDGHTVALKNGKVLAWGNNYYGQCNVPVAAQSGVTAIATQGDFTLALRDGQVLAWGDNNSGQCTVPVEAQTGVIAISAGGHHSVALKSGAVLEWGVPWVYIYEVPAAAQSNVMAVSAGWVHTVALLGSNEGAKMMEVQGNSFLIANGDNTPSKFDHTDFGSTLVEGGAVVRTYVVRNTGSTALNLTGSPRVAVSGTHDSEFAVSTQPEAFVDDGSTTTFQVTFNPFAIGLRSATLSISNDTLDNNPYYFAIHGIGSEIPALQIPAMAGTEAAVIKWASITNLNYTIRYSTNLRTGFLILKTGIPATPPVNTYTDNINGIATKYWGVSIEE